MVGLSTGAGGSRGSWVSRSKAPRSTGPYRELADPHRRRHDHKLRPAPGGPTMVEDHPRSVSTGGRAAVRFLNERQRESRGPLRTR